MRLPSRIVATLPVVCALALTLPTTVAGAGIPQAQEQRDTRPEQPDAVFPWWKWLRDSAVEAVFGKPSSRPRTSTPATSLRSRYRNDVVVRFNVTTAEEEDALAKATEQLFLDVWAFTPEFVDVRLGNDALSSLLRLLPVSLEPSTLIPDVAAAVRATYPSTEAEEIPLESRITEAVQMRTSLDGVGNLFFQNYQKLSVINSWMRLLEAMFPSVAKMTSIGQSYEGRDVFAFRVGAPRNGTEKDHRKIILVTGGLHGREWISTSSVTYLLWSTITSYGNESIITRLLQEVDIVFIPVLNPDGYEYTWESDRLWRKSRQETKMHFCRGIDLDHAFGYGFDAAERTTDPCSESYGGDEPFEAVEASVLAEWARNETGNGAKFLAFLDLHSYSQQVLYPYAYTCEKDPPNRENLEELAVGLAKAIRLSSGEPYTVASACEGAVAFAPDASNATARLEVGGGAALDWFHHEMQARYSYQIKLRDTGSYGFLVPSENIVPTGEEMLSALKYLADYLLGNNGIEKSLVQQQQQQQQHQSGRPFKDLRRRRR